MASPLSKLHSNNGSYTASRTPSSILPRFAGEDATSRPDDPLTIDAAGFCRGFITIFFLAADQPRTAATRLIAASIKDFAEPAKEISLAALEKQATRFRMAAAKLTPDAAI